MTAAYSYVYDAAGNPSAMLRTSMTAYTETVGANTTVVNRSFNAANQLATATDAANGTTSYYYDANGSLTRIRPPGVNAGEAGEQVYSYNQRNLLTAVATGAGGGVYNPITGYAYDGDGNRVRQTDYSGSQPVTTYANDNTGLSQALLADNGTTQTANLFGLDLISQDNGVQTRTLLADGLGSVRQEMANGAIETATTYEPYGNVLAQIGSSGTTYAFTGEQFDGSTGLLYLRARYYNPALHLFMGRDPWRGSVWRPSTLHGFNYVGNNPVNRVDPTGLCEQYLPDEYCWSLAEQAWRKGLGTLAEMGRLSTSELEAKLLRDTLGIPNCPLSASIATCLYNQSTAYSSQSTPNWDHQAPFLDYSEFDKITPDALIVGSSASGTLNLLGPLGRLPVLNQLNLSGICGVDVLLSLNEPPSVFVYGGYGGGWQKKDTNTRWGMSGNVTPVAGGLVWELDGHKNYEGPYQTLSVDASAAVGLEANIFRSPDAFPFDDERPGSWGFTVAPNGGGGASVTVTRTCYVEITSFELWNNVFTGNWKAIAETCRE